MKNTSWLSARRLPRMLWWMAGAGPGTDETPSALDGASFGMRADCFLDLNEVICVSQSIMCMYNAVPTDTGQCTSSHAQSFSATMGYMFKGNAPPKRTPQGERKGAQAQAQGGKKIKEEREQAERKLQSRQSCMVQVRTSQGERYNNMANTAQTAHVRESQSHSRRAHRVQKDRSGTVATRQRKSLAQCCARCMPPEQLLPRHTISCTNRRSRAHFTSRIA